MPSPSLTIGRRVWYWPTPAELNDPTQSYESSSLMNQISAEQPFDAGVMFVHSNRLVNLLVTDHEGRTFQRLQVHLLQENEIAAYATGGFCEWPYRIQQAKTAA